MPRALSEIYLEDATIDGVPYPSQGGHPISLTYLNEALFPLFPLLSGWAPAIETWEYASATTITVPSGAGGRYQKGDKIRLKQGGGYKYFYIVSVADKLLTVTGGSDYTVANEAITDNYYSKAMNPQGWPVSLGQRVGDNAVWHAGNDSVGRVGRPIMHWLYKDSSDSGWWRVFSFTPTGETYNTSVVHISAFSNTSGINDRAHWELVLSGAPGGSPIYSSAYLRSFGAVYTDMFQLRYDTVTGTYTLFFYIPQYTVYELYITFPKAPCPYSLYDSAMEPTGSVNIPVKYEKAPVLLWSGSWSSGSITVPDTDKYTTFRIHLASSYAWLFATKRTVGGLTHIAGGGGMSNLAGTLLITSHFRASMSGNVWTLIASKEIAHNSGGNHAAQYDTGVGEIYGLI